MSDMAKARRARRAEAAWSQFARQAAFVADCQLVISLRMLRLAAGGPAAAGEATRMVAEKFSTFADAQWDAAAALPRGGLYQITLSEDGLVDIIQNGHYLKKKASHMRRDCPAMRRSIRVELTAAPLVLQFGGIEMPSVTIAVAPAE